MGQLGEVKLPRCDRCGKMILLGCECDRINAVYACENWNHLPAVTGSCDGKAYLQCSCGQQFVSPFGAVFETVQTQFERHFKDKLAEFVQAREQWARLGERKKVTAEALEAIDKAFEKLRGPRE